MSRSVILLISNTRLLHGPIPRILHVQHTYVNYPSTKDIPPPRFAARMMTTFLFGVAYLQTENPHKYKNNDIVNKMLQIRFTETLLGDLVKFSGGVI